MISPTGDFLVIVVQSIIDIIPLLKKCIYIYIYIYIYIGSISLLIYISLNIIDIFCLHIFFC